MCIRDRCAAGVFSEEVALLIARARGALMADAASNSDGAMCAVPAPVEEVRKLIEQCGLSVVIANHNAPDQVVLSGDGTAINDAVQRFSAAGVNARRLDVATAFHSEIVSAATVPFASFLAAIPFGMPEVPEMCIRDRYAGNPDLAAVVDKHGPELEKILGKMCIRDRSVTDAARRG